MLGLMLKNASRNRTSPHQKKKLGSVSLKFVAACIYYLVCVPDFELRSCDVYFGLESGFWIIKLRRGKALLVLIGGFGFVSCAC